MDRELATQMTSKIEGNASPTRNSMTDKQLPNLAKERKARELPISPCCKMERVEPNRHWLMIEHALPSRAKRRKDIELPMCI
jgi:hypothetical protein